MSNPITELLSLSKNENAVVAKSASKALSYADELKKGTLSQDEYSALLEQLATSKEIAEEIDDKDLKDNLSVLINTLIKIGSAVAGL